MKNRLLIWYGELTTQQGLFKRGLGFLFPGMLWLMFFLVLPGPALALDQMSDKQLDQVHAQIGSASQTAAGEGSFHYDNAVTPVSQAASDIQTLGGAATTFTALAGPPAIIQNTVNDAQTVASSITLGIGF